MNIINLSRLLCRLGGQQAPLPFILLLPLAGGRPCLDFINTIDWRLQPTKYRDALVSYADLLAFSLRVNLIDSTLYLTLTHLAETQPADAEMAITEARAFRDALTAIVDDVAGTPSKVQKERPRTEALELFDAARRRAHSSETLWWGGQATRPQAVSRERRP